MTHSMHYEISSPVNDFILAFYRLLWRQIFMKFHEKNLRVMLIEWMENNGMNHEEMMVKKMVNERKTTRREETEDKAGV